MDAILDILVKSETKLNEYILEKSVASEEPASEGTITFTEDQKFPNITSEYLQKMSDLAETKFINALLKKLFRRKQLYGRTATGSSATGDFTKSGTRAVPEDKFEFLCGIYAKKYNH